MVSETTQKDLMTFNNSHDATIEKRRELVADGLLAGLSQREIVLSVNKAFADTGDEFALGTINGDVKAVKAAWRKASIASVDRYIAEQNARIQDIISELWPYRSNARTAEVILSALKRQAELFGTDKPLKTENDTSLTVHVVYADVDENALTPGNK